MPVQLDIYQISISLFVVLVAVAMGVMCAAIIHRKGYKKGWIGASFLFGIFNPVMAILVVLIAPSQRAPVGPETFRLLENIPDWVKVGLLIWPFAYLISYLVFGPMLNDIQSAPFENTRVHVGDHADKAY